MIECHGYAERVDGWPTNGWLPGVLLRESRGWTLAAEPYAKVTRWPTRGGPTFAALVHCNGYTLRLVTAKKTARAVYRWAAGVLRETVTGGRDRSSVLYHAGRNRTI